MAEELADEMWSEPSEAEPSCLDAQSAQGFAALNACCGREPMYAFCHRGATAECTRCGVTRTHRTRGYQCTRCPAHFCPNCKKAMKGRVITAPRTNQPGGSTDPPVHTTPRNILPQEPIPSAPAGGAQIPPVHSAELGGIDIPRLMDKFLQLPTVCPLRTLKWCPSRLESRWASILEQRMAAAITATKHAPGQPTEILHHLLLREIARLVLWQPQMQADAENPNEYDQPALLKTIKTRMRMAERREWEQLMDTYLTALQGRDHQGQRRVPTMASETQTLQNAMTRAEEGNVTGAVQLLTGLPPVQPSLETLEAIKKLFHTQPLTPDNSIKCTAAVLRCRRIAAKPTTEEATRRRLFSLSTGAEPGPSGMRNSHIKALCRTRTGTETFRQFTTMWTSMALRPAVTRIWLNLKVAPLRKPSGGVRPSGLCECLLKASTGLSMHVHRDKLKEIFEPQQLSVHTPGGAEQIVFTNRALASLRPDIAQTQLDMKNAYGEASKIATLEEAADTKHPTANTFANVCQTEFTVWVQIDQDTWTSFPVYDGYIQGEVASNPGFCFNLRRALRTFQPHTATTPSDRLGQATNQGTFSSMGVTFRAYADDVFMYARPQDVPRLLDDLQKHLQNFQLYLELAKCATWVPQWSQRTTEELDQCHLAAAIRTKVTLEHHGLLHLGAGADDKYEAYLGPFRQSASPIAKRLQKARQAIAAINKILDTPLQGNKAYPCWLILTKSTAHALDFDTRVHAPSVVECYMKELQKEIIECSKRILNIDNDKCGDIQATQLLLPPQLGGCNLPDGELLLHIAALGAMASVEDKVAATLMTFATDLTQEEVKQHIDYQGVNECKDRLRNSGLVLDNLAEPVPIEQDTSEDSNDLDFLAPGLGKKRRGIISRTLKELQQQKAKKLLQDATLEVDKARIRSCGGTSCIFLTTTPAKPSDSLTDAEFRNGMQWRLGLRPTSTGQCKHKGADGSLCDAPLDRNYLHATTCKHGQAVFRTHNAVVQVLHNCAKEAGLWASINVIVPEFSTTKPGGEILDAELDLATWAPDNKLTTYVDVTVRHPLADRYVHRAARFDSAANDRAATEKRSRYPASQGVKVTLFPCEDYGRLGRDAERYLELLSGAAEDRDRLRSLAPRSRIQGWTVQISRVLFRAVAQAVMEAQGCFTRRTPDLQGNPATGHNAAEANRQAGQAVRGGQTDVAS